MMDESPTKPVNFMNGEKICNILETLPSQIKAENSCSCASDMGLLKAKEADKKPENCFEESFSSAEKKMYPEFHELKNWDSIAMNRRLRRAEATIERNFNRLEKLWMNRGLPVDNETLYSAASKDAFDLKGLKESLPSTSEEKPGDNELRRKWLEKLDFKYKRTHPRRCEEIKKYSEELNRKMFSLFHLPPPDKDLPKVKDTKSHLYRPLLQLLRRRAQFRQVPYSELVETPSTDEKKERSEGGENSDMEKTGLDWDFFHCAPFKLNRQRKCDQCTPIDKTPLDLKLEERSAKSSDIENNQQNISFPPLLKPSWDSEKNWITDFQSPPISVPLNSPTKLEANVGEGESVLSLSKLLAQTRISRFKELREESKLRKVNSHRGVPSEDMDRSVCEDPAEEIQKNATRSIRELHFKIRDLRRALREEQDPLLKALSDARQLLKMPVRAYINNFGNTKSHSGVNPKSDQVLLD